MREVTVNKEALLRIVNGNRELHREHFEEAYDNWATWALEKLEGAIESGRSGRKSDDWFMTVRKVVYTPKPEDHTQDYDDVIGMLGMHVEKNITLTLKEFQQYVNDDWQWKANFTETYNSYVVTDA